MSPPKKAKTTLDDHWGSSGNDKDVQGPPTTKQEPKLDDNGHCRSLRRSIDKWGIIGPYSTPADEDKWSAYYAERTALQFRHDQFFPQDDDGNGEELPHFARCYRWSNCRNADVLEETLDSPTLCAKCKKHVASRGEYLARYPDHVKASWCSLLKQDPSLESVYNNGFTAQRPPFMRMHCTESYATDCHESGTPEGEYTGLREHIQKRIQDTILTTTLTNDTAERKALGKLMASGLYILDYFANFEECDVKANVRTVNFLTRLYPPNGTGQSIDLYWYRHFRSRNTIANEKYSTLHVSIRDLRDCDPFHPTHSFLSDRGDRHDCGKRLAILDGDTNEDRVRKDFVTLPLLNELKSVLFGPQQTKLSPRKVFGLLARASGAHAVREEGGWVYAGMRKRYELYPGEASDGEEDGPENGPDCIIM